MTVPQSQLRAPLAMTTSIPTQEQKVKLREGSHFEKERLQTFVLYFWQTNRMHL